MLDSDLPLPPNKTGELDVESFGLKFANQQIGKSTSEDQHKLTG